MKNISLRLAPWWVVAVLLGCAIGVGECGFYFSVGSSVIILLAAALLNFSFPQRLPRLGKISPSLLFAMLVVICSGRRSGCARSGLRRCSRSR